MSSAGVRRVLVAGVVAVLLGIAVGVGPASAHTSLGRSDPPDGGMVAVGRTELSLWFDEPVDLASGHFVLRTDEGAPLRVTPDPASGRSDFLVLHTTPLRRGVLVLSWSVTSAVDGHVSSGSITFGAGVRPPATASGGSGASLPEVLVRWLQLIAMIVAVGALVAPTLLTRATSYAPQSPQQAARLGTIAALVCLATSCATPSGFLDSLETDRWAQLWVLRGVALAVAVAALAGLARRGPSVPRTATAGCALVMAAVADAAAGHAAGLPRASTAAVVATSVHVLAAGAWLGTLALLATCLVPTMRRLPESRRPLLEATWRSFGPVAAVAVALVVASGLYLAGRHLPGLAALTTGWYGLALIGKTVLLAVALAAALHATLVAGRRVPGLGGATRLLRPAGDSGFPRLVLTELVVLGVAVVLAAVMTTVPTARTATAGEPSPGTGTGVTVDGLFVTFEAAPAGSGEFRLAVQVNAVTRPQPGPVTGADVLLVGDGGRQVRVPLQRVEAGHFEGATPAPSSGDWQAWVSVHRTAAEDAVAQVDWRSAPVSTPGPTRLEVVTTVLAGLLALGALVGVALRRRREADSAPEPARQGITVTTGGDAP
ncbi:MAG TPA: copper resistance protein CopC [Nocardioides sp.]|nr:copper resistance protein CopC [Nocardioides sp.]